MLEPPRLPNNTSSSTSAHTHHSDSLCSPLPARAAPPSLSTMTLVQPPRQQPPPPPQPPPQPQPPSPAAESTLLCPAQTHLCAAANPRPPQALLVRSRSNRVLAPPASASSFSPTPSASASATGSPLLQPRKPPRVHSPRTPQYYLPASPSGSRSRSELQSQSTNPYANAEISASTNASLNWSANAEMPSHAYANTLVVSTSPAGPSSAGPESLGTYSYPTSTPTSTCLSLSLSPLAASAELEVPVATVQRPSNPSRTQAPQPIPIRVKLVRSASVRSNLGLGLGFGMGQVSPDLSHPRSAYQRFPDVATDLSLVATGTAQDEASEQVPDRSALFTDQQAAESEAGNSGAALVRPMTRFTTLDEQPVDLNLDLSLSLEPVSSSLSLAPVDTPSLAESTSLNSLLGPNLEVLSAFHVPEEIKDLLPPNSTTVAPSPQSERKPSRNRSTLALAQPTNMRQQAWRPIRSRSHSHSLREPSPRSPLASQELLLQVASPPTVSVERVAPLSLPPVSFTFEDLPERRRFVQELSERFANAVELPERDSAAAMNAATDRSRQLADQVCEPAASRSASALPLRQRQLADEYNVQQLCAEHRHALELMRADGHPLSITDASLLQHLPVNGAAAAAAGQDASARRGVPCPLCAARPSLPLDAGVYNSLTQNVRGVQRYYVAHAAHIRQFIDYYEHFYSHEHTKLLGTRTTGFKELIAQRNSAT